MSDLKPNQFSFPEAAFSLMVEQTAILNHLVDLQLKILQHLDPSVDYDERLKKTDELLAKYKKDYLEFSMSAGGYNPEKE